MLSNSIVTFYFDKTKENIKSNASNGWARNVRESQWTRSVGIDLKMFLTFVKWTGPFSEIAEKSISFRHFISSARQLCYSSCCLKNIVALDDPVGFNANTEIKQFTCNTGDRYILPLFSSVATLGSSESVSLRFGKATSSRQRLNPPDQQQHRR